MRKFINVINQEKAEYLINLGFKAREEIVEVNNKPKTIYVFIEEKNLLKILNDKSKFSKKDFYYSNLMKF